MKWFLAFVSIAFMAYVFCLGMEDQYIYDLAERHQACFNENTQHCVQINKEYSQAEK